MEVDQGCFRAKSLCFPVPEGAPEMHQLRNIEREQSKFVQCRVCGIGGEAVFSVCRVFLSLFFWRGKAIEIPAGCMCV